MSSLFINFALFYLVLFLLVPGTKYYVKAMRYDINSHRAGRRQSEYKALEVSDSVFDTVESVDAKRVFAYARQPHKTRA
jgi:hypothetical protein